MECAEAATPRKEPGQSVFTVENMIVEPLNGGNRGSGAKDPAEWVCRAVVIAIRSTFNEAGVCHHSQAPPRSSFRVAGTMIGDIYRKKIEEMID